MTTQTLTALQQHMAETGMNQAAIARAIDKSTSTVSQYLKGQYPGDNAALEAMISSYLQRANDRKKSPKMVIPFVQTATAAKITDVIDMAAEDVEINVIYGAAGLGKTVALRHYASSHPNSLFIETDPGYTGKVFLQVLSAKLGLPTKGTVHDLTNAVVAKLRGTDKIILIDEAELLPLTALEIVRRIHDHAQVGVILAGMPRLICNLRGKNGELAQLYSRVGFAINLGEQLPATDMHNIIRSVMGEDSAPILDDLAKAAQGNTRRLSKLMRGVVRAARLNESAPTIEMVKNLSAMLIF